MARRPLRAIVCGLDLSLRGTGVAIVDATTWGLDVTRVRTRRFGEQLPKTASPDEKADRLDLIVNAVLVEIVARGVTHVFVEDYSYGMAQGAHQLGELGGTIRLCLRRAFGHAPTPVNNSTARRFFLGAGAPRKGIKNHVAAVGKAMKLPFAGDELDAFVVANYGLSELGFPALSIG